MVKQYAGQYTADLAVYTSVCHFFNDNTVVCFFPQLVIHFLFLVLNI